MANSAKTKAIKFRASVIYALSEVAGTGQGQGEGDNCHRTRATNCSLSSMTEHYFQGIYFLPKKGGSVTYVSGTFCYLCSRSLTVDCSWLPAFSPRFRPLKHRHFGRSWTRKYSR